jgi:predicted Fe-Mo cluster-binding NifX family protein
MKILITITGDDVAPRFDLTTEVLVANAENGQLYGNTRNFLLPRPSTEELCSLILKENVTVVVCGGIEEEHYSYLQWKKIEVIDGIIGPYAAALKLSLTGNLKTGVILFDPDIHDGREGKHME